MAVVCREPNIWNFYSTKSQVDKVPLNYQRTAMSVITYQNIARYHMFESRPANGTCKIFRPKKFVPSLCDICVPSGLTSNQTGSWSVKSIPSIHFPEQGSRAEQNNFISVQSKKQFSNCLRIIPVSTSYKSLKFQITRSLLISSNSRYRKI